MRKPVRLFAKHVLTYHGRHIEPGEVFEALASDALVFMYRREAAIAPKPLKPQQVREPEPERPRRRRSYRRRDLVAEA